MPRPELTAAVGPRCLALYSSNDAVAGAGGSAVCVGTDIAHVHVHIDPQRLRAAGDDVRGSASAASRQPMDVGDGSAHGLGAFTTGADGTPGTR